MPRNIDGDATTAMAENTPAEIPMMIKSTRTEIEAATTNKKPVELKKSFDTRPRTYVDHSYVDHARDPLCHPPSKIVLSSRLFCSLDTESTKLNSNNSGDDCFSKIFNVRKSSMTFPMKLYQLLHDVTLSTRVVPKIEAKIVPVKRNKKSVKGEDEQQQTKDRDNMDSSSKIETKYVRVSSIIQWNPHGRSFIINDRKLLQEFVLSHYFSSNNYNSFNRQLNIYGFHHLSGERDNGSYYSPYFLRTRPDLVHLMKRNCAKDTGYKPISRPEDEPNFYTMQFMPNPYVPNDDCYLKGREVFDSEANSEGTTVVERSNGDVSILNDFHMASSSLLQEKFDDNLEEIHELLKEADEELDCELTTVDDFDISTVFDEVSEHFDSMSAPAVLGRTSSPDVVSRGIKSGLSQYNANVTGNRDNEDSSDLCHIIYSGVSTCDKIESSGNIAYSGISNRNFSATNPHVNEGTNSLDIHLFTGKPSNNYSPFVPTAAKSSMSVPVMHQNYSSFVQLPSNTRMISNQSSTLSMQSRDYYGQPVNSSISLPNNLMINPQSYQSYAYINPSVGLHYPSQKISTCNFSDSVFIQPRLPNSYQFNTFHAQRGIAQNDQYETRPFKMKKCLSSFLSTNSLDGTATMSQNSGSM